MLGEELGGAGYLVSSCLRDKVIIASVVINQWAEVPSVRPTASLQSLCVGGFVYDGLASRGGKGEAIPIVRAPNGFISRHAGVNARSSHQVESILDLGCELVPKLKGEFAVSCCKGTDKMILEHLDWAFCRVHAMIVWLN
jgi:hypothetical protein